VHVPPEALQPPFGQVWVAPASVPADVQLPETHVEPLAHTLPQLPQLLLSLCSLTQAPLHSE
jgi:hypothetical protein